MYTGHLFENDDHTWSGPIHKGVERYDCFLIKNDGRSYLEIRPHVKKGISKRVIETLRVQRTNRSSGPVALVPHPEHPLCIWPGIKDTDTGRRCFNVKPDRMPRGNNPF